jgi:hypothetical protein
MRNTTSRALQATAIVAGVAALGASFVGTASADTNPLGGNNYGDSGSQGFSGFDGLGDSSSPGIDNGIVKFEVPTLGMGSRGMRTDGGLGGIGDLGGNNSDNGDNTSDLSNNCNNTFQNPLQCENGTNLDLFGHTFNSSYKGKSIGSHGMRTDGGLGDFGGFGSNNSGGSDSTYGTDGMNFGTFLSHDDSRSDTRYTHEGDGLNDHRIELPLGN